MTALALALRQPLSRLRGAAVDRVVLALLAALLALGAADAAQLLPSVRYVLGALVSIAPFLALAVGIAAYAAASGSDRLIARVFSGSPVRTVVLAAVFGALSPFCSCGVIPLIAAMLQAGVPLAPVMAFWLSSPVMDPEMFVLTAAGVGTGFAVAKTVAAAAMGLLGGFTVLALQRGGGLRNPLIAGGSGGGCGSEPKPGEPRSIAWRFWHEPVRRAEFRRVATRTGLFLTKWLAIAFLAESLMMAYIPAAWVAAAVGDGSALAIPLAAVVGVPTYLNGYAAIPLIAGLIEMGMSGGAALAFATAGAVSCIPAAIAVWALVRRSVFALYIGLGLGGAMLAGLLYELGGAPI